MDIEPVPGVLAAVERGCGQRGRRGGPNPWLATSPGGEQMSGQGRRWSRVRAVVLTLLGEGWSTQAIAEELTVSRSWVQELVMEACDAVLRTPASSPEAEAACAPAWRRWCDKRGDAEACARL